MQVFELKNDISPNNQHFFTADTNLLQIGQLCRKAGTIVLPHIHNPVRKDVVGFGEFLYVQNGCVHVTVYDALTGKSLNTRSVRGNQCVYLERGAHGMVFEKDTLFLEVKEGPYLGAQSKLYIQQ